VLLLRHGWHALTTGWQDTSGIRASTQEMMLDWLAVGLDPKRVVLFVQSAVKEHAELHLLLSMIVPTPWLLRNRPSRSGTRAPDW
jgi:tryptophanyl-tRNA synthetase